MLRHARRNHGTRAALGLAAALGCGRTEGPATPQARLPGPPPAETQPAVPADMTPKTTPKTTPPPSGPPPADPVAPEAPVARAGAKVKLALKTVETAPGAAPFTLHPLASGALAVTGRRAAAVLADTQAPTWTSIPDAPATEGLGFELAGGAWPDATLTVASMIAPRTTPRRATLRWDGAAWSPIPEKADGGVVTSLAPWTGGRTLVVRHVDMWSGSPEGFVPRIEAIGASGAIPLQLPARARPVTVATSPSGQVFVVMARDEPAEDDSLAGNADVARLVEGAGPQAITPLPALGELRPRANDLRTLLVLADDDVWLAGGVGGEDDATWKPYVVHFDGKAWTRHTLPASFGGLLSTATRCGGALWFTTSERLGPGSSRWVAGRADRPEWGSLWRRDADGTWHLVDVALDRRAKGEKSGAPYRPSSVACAGASTLWLSLEPAAEVIPIGWDEAQTHVLARASL